MKEGEPLVAAFTTEGFCCLRSWSEWPIPLIACWVWQGLGKGAAKEVADEVVFVLRSGKSSVWP